MTEPRVALVTGANRGTGLAVARELSARGLLVAALGRSPAAGEPFDPIDCDLADRAAVDRAFRVFASRYGRLDICVMNAAVRRFGTVADLSPRDWDESIATNLSSVFRLTQLLLPRLRAASGHIVLMGSHAGARHFEGGAAYCATKAALAALAEVLLIEERVHGVRTTLLAPGAIANRAGDQDPAKLSPQSVARLVASLALDLPDDLAVGSVELRPAVHAPGPVVGIARLQNV